MSHLAGNLKLNPINGIINLVQVLLQKPCVTAKAKERAQYWHRHTHAYAGLSGHNVVKCKVQRGKAALQHVGCSFGNEPFASSAHCVAWGAGENNKSSDSNKTAFACDFQSKAKKYSECGRAHRHTHTRWHGDAHCLCFTQAQTFVGPPRGRGREEGHIHVACSLA